MRAYLAIHRIVDGTVTPASLVPYNGEICGTCSPGSHPIQWVPANFAENVMLRPFIRTDVLSFDTQDNARDWAALDASLAAMAGSLVCGFQPDNATSAYMVIVHSWMLPARTSPSQRCAQCPPRLGVSGKWIVGASASSTPMVASNPTATYVLQFSNAGSADSWLASADGGAFVNNCLLAGFSIP